MRANYNIRQGEPLHIFLIAVEGEITDVVSVSAKLKHAGPNLSVPSVSAPSVAEFTVDDAPAPDVGWVFTIADEVTSTLKPGYYITNAKLLLSNGDVLKTDHVTIEVRGSVT